MTTTRFLLFALTLLLFTSSAPTWAVGCYLGLGLALAIAGQLSRGELRVAPFLAIAFAWPWVTLEAILAKTRTKTS